SAACGLAERAKPQAAEAHPGSTPMKYPSRPCCLLVLLLALLGAEASAVPARAAPPPAAAPVAVAPLLAERWSWAKVYSAMENGLSSRRRMVQFGALAMCLALYIIWWRR